VITVTDLEFPNLWEQAHWADQDFAERAPVLLPQQPDNRVYGRGAWIYMDAGWRGVLPLPPGQKSPPPKGYTGYDGKWPTTAQIEEWVEGRPDSNLMLRVTHGVIGIDVDAYGNKTGGQTLKEAEARWGPLPATFRSSARSEDKVSGVRIFRVPEDVLFRTVIDFRDDSLADIEIIQSHHRYITAWPSIHPSGQRYRWFSPAGTLLPEGQVPRVDDLPELPAAWVDALTKDALRRSVFDGAPNRPRACDAVVDEKVYQQLMDLTDNGAQDDVVATRLQKAHLDLTSGAGSRYDTTRDHVAALVRFHGRGRVGVPRALTELYAAYVSEVSDSRPPRVAGAEFWRMVEGAALLVAATPLPTMIRTTHPGEGDESHTDAAEDGPSWSPIDLTTLLSGVREPVLPTLFERSDGQCLLYRGLVHSVHGESESGKSLIIQLVCARLVNRGQKVLYIDHESDVASVVDRLLDFGADSVAVADHFVYVQPEVRPDSVEERRAWEEILCGKYAIAVIDGVTDALGIFGCSTSDNDEIAGWLRTVPKKIAARTGAAVVLIDHVTKDTATRNRWAIGGQAKMAGLTGAAYTVEIVAPLGRGMRGEVVLRIAKDRPGAIRPHCGPSSRKDRTQEAARIIVDATDESPTVTIGAPGNKNPSEQNAFRPTNLMERACKAVEDHPGLTKNKIAEKIGGKKQWALQAIDILRAEGYVTTTRGQTGHDVYDVVKPYRQTDDPSSDSYVNLGNVSLPK
jgi:hypothetical protein